MIQASKLLNQTRCVLQAKQYSPQTEKIYLDWIYRFLLYRRDKDSKSELNSMGGADNEGVGKFLTFLAEERDVSAATQHQALQAIGFLFREVLQTPVANFNFVRVKPQKKYPAIMNRSEVAQVLDQLTGDTWLMASLLYGGGLRLQECVLLRYRDLDFLHHQIRVGGYGDITQRNTLLPGCLEAHLKRQLEKVRIQWEENQLIGDFVGAALPQGYEIMHPGSARELGWQYVFPSRNLCIKSGTNQLRQHHRSESYFQKAVKRAIRQAQITKHASCHTFRHSFATHLLEDGYDVHTVKELLGHKDIRTTMMYTHLLNREQYQVRSPLDMLTEVY
jgi:integron integrase